LSALLVFILPVSSLISSSPPRREPFPSVPSGTEAGEEFLKTLLSN